MPQNDDFALLAAIRELATDQQPSDDELAWSPVLDDWELRIAALQETSALFVEGRVAGRDAMVDGARMRSSTVTAIGRDGTWLRTMNTLYRLGYKYHPQALILRVIQQPDWGAAARYLLAQLPESSLHWGDHGDGDWAAYDAARDLRAEAESDIRLWETAHGDAADLFKALRGMGRKAAARAVLPLMARPRDTKAVEQVWYELKLTEGADDGDAADILRLAWHSLAAGNFDAAGLDANDAIAAAHALASKAYEKPPNDDAEPAAGDGNGVVVLARIGGIEGTTQHREMKTAMKDLVGRRLPLAPAPDVDAARAALMAEFPHLERAIRVLLGDLRGRDHPQFRNTVLVGPAGAGKTRFVRRLGESVGLPLSRFDAGSAWDGMIAGSSKGWHSAHGSFPVEALLSRRRADAMILLDELEKAGGSSHNGVMSNALLQMLERETSQAYPDKFFGAPVDISHVSWIATANSETGMPEPLRDRFRILHVSEPSIDHLIVLSRSIVRDLARESGEDAAFYPDLSDGELAAVEGLWRGGSVRRLRRIVEIVIARRETHPRN